jgi:DNA-binding GntR family transcriptional regulator
MPHATAQAARRTSVDEVFDHLHDQILSLELKPGDRISEAEIAASFGVSRQPVRDAFSKLANLDMLLIRPQRATEVRRFSMRKIEKTRFIRAAIETEVLRRAAALCDDKGQALLQSELAQQEEAVKNKDVDLFGQLDYEFHKILCEIGQVDYAFEVILEEKAKVDRLCMLGLEKEQRMPELVADHQAIAAAICAHDSDTAITAGMAHLSRLDATIASITATNANYFENDDV